MSPEVWTVIGVGVALGGLILRMGFRLDGLAGRVDSRLGKVEDRLSALGERVARIEGLMEGWRASEGGTE